MHFKGVKQGFLTWCTKETRHEERKSEFSKRPEGETLKELEQLSSNYGAWEFDYWLFSQADVSLDNEPSGATNILNGVWM